MGGLTFPLMDQCCCCCSSTAVPMNDFLEGLGLQFITEPSQSVRRRDNVIQPSFTDTKQWVTKFAIFNWTLLLSFSSYIMYKNHLTFNSNLATNLFSVRLHVSPPRFGWDRKRSGDAMNEINWR